MFLSAFSQSLVNLLDFFKLCNIERANTHNDNRAKEYTWTVNCVEVVSSWPPKNPLTTTYHWVQELETDTAIAIKTSKCTAKIVSFMMLNSIIMVCLDRWWCKSAQLLCSSKMMLHWKAWTLLRWLRNQKSGKNVDTHQSHSYSLVAEHLFGCFLQKATALHPYCCQFLVVFSTS